METVAGAETSQSGDAGQLGDLGQPGDATEPSNAGSLGVVDRALYALFSGHSDRQRHGRDRRQYRASTVTASFDVYLARVYGLSWAAFCLGRLAAFGLVLDAGFLRPRRAGGTSPVGGWTAVRHA